MGSQPIMSHSPSMTVRHAMSRQGWSQKWLHDFENRVFHTHFSTFVSLGGLPWAQGAAGSNPAAPRPSHSKPATRVSELAEHTVEAIVRPILQ